MAPSKHPLVGAGVFDCGAKANQQQAGDHGGGPLGSIEVGDLALLQYFCHGCPCRLIPVTPLAGSFWVLYEDV